MEIQMLVTLVRPMVGLDGRRYRAVFGTVHSSDDEVMALGDVRIARRNIAAAVIADVCQTGKTIYHADAAGSRYAESRECTTGAGEG